MAVNILMSEEKRKRQAVYNIIRSLGDMPKTTVITDGENIYINSEYVYIPDFEVVWCSIMKHYRVYICMGDGHGSKVRSKYTLFTISGRLAAAGFIGVYQFIFKHRANNKENPAQGTLTLKYN